LGVDEFFAFGGAVEVEAVFGFVVAVAKRHQIGFVVHAEGYGDVLGAFEDRAHFVWVGYFSVFTPNMKRHTQNKAKKQY
jgi:hypothetical protein